MYTAKLPIPSVGEKNTFPQHDGVGFQVFRLGFEGSEDPLGNPEIRTSDGGARTLMNVGDPIRDEFRGLEVENRDNPTAAGTVALVRIYEEGDSMLAAPPRRQMVARAPAAIESYERNASVGIGAGDSTKRETLVSDGRDRAWRLSSLVMGIGDRGTAANVTDGWYLRVIVKRDTDELKGVTLPIYPYVERKFTIMRGDVIVPANQKLQITLTPNGNGGDGTVSCPIRSSLYEDTNSPIPPS